MSADDVELVRRIYGFNWAAVGSRTGGFAELAEVIAPGFTSRVSPELGGGVLEGIEGLKNLTLALEEDFSEFHYEPQEFLEAGDGTVVAVGRIAARARASRMPVEGEFGHVWRLEDGKARSVEAFRNRRAAEEAAGL